MGPRRDAWQFWRGFAWGVLLGLLVQAVVMYVFMHFALGWW